MPKRNTLVKPKIKGGHQKETISKEEIAGFKTTHMKFNFSFMTTNNTFSFNNPDFSNLHKAQLMQRIYELSCDEYIVVNSRKKNIGIEFIEKSNFKRPVEYGRGFDGSEFRRKANDKFAVFRLYTNNNPIAARIIGKLVNKIFYVMFIDLSHELYDG